MRKARTFVVVCAVFFSLLKVNTSYGQESNSPSAKPLNIVVILDTSDRVSRERNPGQMESDIEIITEIADQFEKIVQKHLSVSESIQYPHRLSFVVPEQPNAPSIPDQIIDSFTIYDSGERRSWPEFLEKKQQLLLALPKLHEFVEQHEQTGSDIWEWFKYEARYYLSDDHQNRIICLSDGYLDFNRSIEEQRLLGTFMLVRQLREGRNWQEKINGSEGLLPIGQDFSDYNVKFLMLEITLRRDRDSGIPYQQDFEIIKEYWRTWLNSMGITDSAFFKQGRSPKPRIRSFITVED